MAETIWIKPTKEDAKTFMDSRVIDVSAANTDGGQEDSFQEIIDITVSKFREAIRNGNRIPLSSDTTTVPPGTLDMVMTLVIDRLAARRPQLASYVNSDSFKAAVKEARDWIDEVNSGDIAPTRPSEFEAADEPEGPKWGDFNASAMTDNFGMTGSGKIDLTTD